MDKNEIRKIIHIDMDAFYASVEQRDHPELRGKPVIVGGLPNSRGVVATCSYEARKFGIHSAMPSAMAYRLCPQAIFIRPNMDKYRSVSQQIMRIFKSFTELVEPLSLDEAYLDVTEDKLGINSATLIAIEIKKRIYSEVGLTSSAGVSFNKFLAKVCSGYQKPNGLTIVTPEHAAQFIDKIPIGDFFGVGKVTEKKLLSMNIKNGADLKKISYEKLIELFNERGRMLYEHARGIDHRPVIPNRKRKSIGKETTLKENLTDIEDMLEVIKGLVDQVVKRLNSHQVLAKCVVVKVKFEDFEQLTRRTTLDEPTNDPAEIMIHAQSLLEQIDFHDKSVRLLGVTTSQFQSLTNDSEALSKGTRVRYEQLKLF